MCYVLPINLYRYVREREMRSHEAIRPTKIKVKNLPNSMDREKMYFGEWHILFSPRTDFISTAKKHSYFYSEEQVVWI